jgi:dihydroorotate dehydrogenase electron transfer subunit
LHDAHHRLTLAAPEIAASAEPGQFLHVWCHPPEELDRPPCAAILRRPFSISRVRPPDGVELLLRVRGTGGRMLAAKRAGESLDVIGPLGRGFRVREGLAVAAVVAGGLGLAPVPFLVERLRERGARVILLVGAAEDERVPFLVERPRAGRATLPELAALGAEVSFVSEAVEGVLVSELLETRLGELMEQSAEVFAIGPRAMLKRLAEVTEGCLPLQVSLEERMACGVGACRSCVVPARAEGRPAYQTVCREGPVFDANEIDWERLEA